MAPVQWDHEKPKTRQKEQEEQLREYVAHHLYPYSPFYRRRFEPAGIAPRNITGFDDLAKLEPTRWSDVTSEPVAFVLRPTERAIIRFGERRLVGAITRAKFRGKVSQVNRDLIDPAYKPIHWHFDGDVPVGYSAEDLERLCEAGRRVLHLAGLTRDDAIVDVTPPGPSLEFWQLVDGARSAGLSAVHFGPGVAGEPRRRRRPHRAGRPARRPWRPPWRSCGPGSTGSRGCARCSSSARSSTRPTATALRTLGQEVGEHGLEVVAGLGAGRGAGAVGRVPGRAVLPHLPRPRVARGAARRGDRLDVAVLARHRLRPAADGRLRHHRRRRLRELRPDRAPDHRVVGLHAPAVRARPGRLAGRRRWPRRPARPAARRAVFGRAPVDDRGRRGRGRRRGAGARPARHRGPVGARRASGGGRLAGRVPAGRRRSTS